MYNVCYKKMEPRGPGMEPKTVWPQVGVAFPMGESDNLVIKMNAIPLTRFWGGELILFKQENKFKASDKDERDGGDLDF